MKKNKRLSILVTILLIGVGISFAYFLGQTLFNGDGALMSGTAASLDGAKLEIKGTLTFTDLAIYPGHKTVSAITATATGDNVVMPYSIVWKGQNGLNTDLKYKVYRFDSEQSVKASCEKKKEIVEGKQHLFESCTIAGVNEDNLVGSGKIPSDSDGNITIVENEFITATRDPSTTAYYYVILEYPNEERNQNADLEGTFTGTVEVQISDASADINILSIYVDKDGNGSYVEQDKIPEDDTLQLSTKSSCTNNAKVSWDKTSKNLIVNSLTKTGTDCNLYFTSNVANDTLKNLGGDLTVSEDTEKCPEVDPSTGQTKSAITGPSTEPNTLLCKGYDDDGETYYFRGTAEKNWVLIDKTYWRIVRINGNGSIRLIYSGKGSAAVEGTGTMVATGIRFNDSYNDNAYVGYMYGKAGQTKGTGDFDAYNKTHANQTNSTILKQVVTWYNGADFPTKAKEYIDKEAGFCGDRTPYANGSGGNIDKKEYGWGTKYTYYGGYVRIYTDKKPTLKCPQKEDLYTMSNDGNKGNGALPVPVGLISADEVMFAGGVYGTTNKTYYLYTGQYYWTMSPYYFYGSTCANVFYVHEYGYLSNYYVYWTTPGVRPVINLRADTPFESGGDGSKTNPFTVKLS